MVVLAIIFLFAASSTSEVSAASETGHESHMMHQATETVENQTMEMNHSIAGSSEHQGMNHNQNDSSGSNNSHSSHGDSKAKSESVGPNWPVLYSFGAINLAIIALAAIMKFSKIEVK